MMEVLKGWAPSNVSFAFTDLSAVAELGLVKLITAGAAVPLWEYAVLAVIIVATLIYHYMDFNLISHCLVGDVVKLSYDFKSPVANEVLQKLKFDRFWPSPWLCSAHLQTTFLHFFVVSPAVDYHRELLVTSDGGTIGIDWLEPLSDGSPSPPRETDSTPIVILVPGLTSDSKSKYILHTADCVMKRGWRTVVVNHRGLGGVPLTSERFYNAGWTQDLRFSIDHVRRVYPAADLVAIGTSLGANILIKYLGEEGEDTPVQAAAAVGCPWDLLVTDRWMRRNSKQKLYGKGLTLALRDFIFMHKESFSKIVDLDHLFKSQTVREFDDRITRIIGNYETVDTYYRKCSSSQFLPGVAIPLLAISAMDDPICTSEAIPWDECRANPNVILGVTAHGGHLAYLEGIFASRIWWVKQTTEFLKVVLESPTLGQKKELKNVLAPVTPPRRAIQRGSLKEVPFTATAAAATTEEAAIKQEEKHIFEPVNVSCANEVEEGEASGGDDSQAQSQTKAQTKSINASIINGPEGNGADEQIFPDGQDDREEGEQEAPEKRAEGHLEGESTEGTRLVVNLRSHAELQALEAVLSQLLHVVRVKSRHISAAPLQSEAICHNVRIPARIPEEVSGGAFSSASAMAASASAMASAAASVLKSSVVLMALVNSGRRGKGGDSAADGGGTQSSSGQRATENLFNGHEPGAGPTPEEPAASSRRIVDPNDLVERLPTDAKLSQLAAIFSRGLDQLEAQNKTSMWLMAYVALAATCPLVGTALLFRMYMRNGGVSGAKRF